jgi:hypothetical protein
MRAVSRALQHWVAAELVSTGAFSKDEARLASRAFVSDRRLDETAAAVAVARATRTLPDGRDWWIDQRKDHLIKGEPKKAYNRMSEDLSESADVILDEWPAPGEPLKIKVPEGLSAGDTFVVGDTDGRRARATVVETGGELTATFDAPVTHPQLAQLHSAALMEAVTRLQRGL